MGERGKLINVLAAHHVGHKVVLRMIKMVSKKYCWAFRELQENLVHAYSDLVTSCKQAVEHMTGLTSYPVVKVFLFLLDSALLRQLADPAELNSEVATINNVKNEQHKTESVNRVGGAVLVGERFRDKFRLLVMLLLTTGILSRSWFFLLQSFR